MTFPDPSTIDSYGGALVDAASIVDPTTDQAADPFNVMKADCAGMTSTAFQAWVRFVTNATTPTLAVSNNGNAPWGNGPSVRSVPTHVGTGHYRLTWPATITDALGVVHTINIVRARVTVEGATLCFAQPAAMSANVVDVYTFNSAASSNDVAGVTLLVEIG